MSLLSSNPLCLASLFLSVPVGVIPLATSIKKSGASKRATLSFLISTPITGVDSILATYGIFGWVFTLYRAVTSMIIAMVAGILTNIFDKDTSTSSVTVDITKPAFPSLTPQAATSFSMNNPNTSPKKEGESCGTGTGSCCCSSNNNTDKKSFSFMAAMKYAFVILLGDIAKPLFWGLLLGALITVAVPMYVYSTASLHIAAGLMLSGVNFIFLSAGPATNTVTIGVVKKMLGTRSLAIYLGSIVIGSILFGLGLDTIFDISDIDPASLIHLHEESNIISTTSAVVLWGFIQRVLYKEEWWW